MPNPREYMPDGIKFTKAYASRKPKSDKNDDDSGGCCLLMVIAMVGAGIAAYLFGHQMWLHGWGIH